MSTSLLHTLVLNADAQPMGVLPLTTIDWRDATTAAYFLDSVEVVSFYENWFVRSPSRTMQVPAVIMKREYVNVQRMIPYSAEMVKLRDGYRCQYCGGVFHEDKLTCDHVTPKSKGGKLEFSNISAACGPCNSRRGNDERIRPKNPPYRPTRPELINKRKQYPITVRHPSWVEFIGWAPELVQVREPVGQPGYTPLVEQLHEPTFTDGDVDQSLMRAILLQQA
jgi:5-methylcytosine-specific restriction endonuclease McrA